MKDSEGKQMITSIYQAIVIGVSAGGIAALEKILPIFDEDYRLPILIVQHIGAEPQNYLVDHFSDRCILEVKEAEDKDSIRSGAIYFAPPNYHLLIEPQRTLALSTDIKVNYSRPSIDVLFETAAEAYCDQVVGVILTGANNDGAAGLAAIHRYGGLTVVQSPETAEVATMPLAAIKQTAVDHILSLREIGRLLASLGS